jgi:hypothetical protein
MGTMPKEARDAIHESLADLERLADEIRVRMHLASMDAKDAWAKLEPRLEEARQHARQAGEASQRAIRDVVKALRELRARL